MSYDLAEQGKIKLEKAMKNTRWKGATASYASKHQFLVRNFGNLPICEHCGVEGQYERTGKWNIQWAKKRIVEYSHNRLDYIGLCRSCHRKYDMTEHELARLRRMANNQTRTQLAKLAEKRKVISKNALRNNGRFAKAIT